ncbi:IPExxxVDY family protein [Flavobacteriaceae bacterium]|nr:IPExxxVDY family protein [Flavobacteriaceae bacterium]
MLTNMAIHKLLVDDFVDESYALLAIHCDVEDYRLAYFLNQTLATKLVRTKEDLDFIMSKASFSVFEWNNPHLQTDWHLIKNQCLVEEAVPISQGLFADSNDKTWVVHCFLPEHQSVDYFLKINNGGGIINEKRILNTIQNISKVTTAYSIDVTKLKSKDHLIFN